jgi:hypothetical protein
MSQIKRSASFCLTFLAATLSIVCLGCGSSSNNGMSSNAMSQAQAQAVAQQVSQAIAQALGTADPSAALATSGSRPSLSAAIGDLRPDASGGCTPIANGQNCNFRISVPDFPCTGAQGGNISITGDLDGTLNTRRRLGERPVHHNAGGLFRVQPDYQR